MPFPLIPLITTGLSAIGGILGNTKAARTSTGSMTPTLAPEYKTLADLLRQRATDRLNSSMDMSGYAANGIGGINDAFRGIQQSAENNLTTRGLGTSPVAGAVTSNIDMARGGNIAQFLNTIPQLQRQFQNEDMTAAGNVLRPFMGTSSTNVGAGSAVAGGLSSAAEMLAYLKGIGAF